MKVLILGDVHGRWDELNIVMAKAMRQIPDLTAFVQVGDFGYAWPGGEPFKLLPKYWDNAPLEKARGLAFYWLDGNHENHDQLDLDQGAYQTNMIYKSRGSINHFYAADFTPRRAMFFGGTTSPDFCLRIQGASWWPQESIKYRQVAEALKVDHPIDMMFSHDHPLAFPYKKYDNNYGEADQAFLDVLREHFKPKLWVFGHHHDFKSGETCGTQWMCAPIIESRTAILWDGDTLTPIKA
jgi:hypothetical protein